VIRKVKNQKISYSIFHYVLYSLGYLIINIEILNETFKVNFKMLTFYITFQFLIKYNVQNQ